MHFPVVSPTKRSRSSPSKLSPSHVQSTPPTSSLPSETDNRARPYLHLAEAHSRQFYAQSNKGQPISLLAEGSSLLPVGRAPLLFLVFTKALCLFSLIIAILQTPQLVLNYLENSKSGNTNILENLRTLKPSTNSANLALTYTHAAIECLILLFCIFTPILLSYALNKFNALSSKIVTTDIFSLHIKGLPPREIVYGTARLEKFMTQFGKIKQIALVVDSRGVNSLKQKREAGLNEIEKMTTQIEAAKSPKCCSCLKVNSKRLQRCLLYVRDFFLKQDLQYQMNRKAFKCTGDAFVTFMREREKVHAQQSLYQPMLHRLCCGIKTPTFSRKNIRLSAYDAPHVDDVKWENFQFTPYSRFWRKCFSFVGGAACIITTLIVTSILDNLKESKFKSDSLSSLLSMTFTNNTWISISISVSISIMNSMMTFILFHLVRFEKHQYESRKRSSIMTKLTLSQAVLNICSLWMNVTWTPWFYLLGIAPVFVVTEGIDFHYNLFISLAVMAISATAKEALLGPFYWIKRLIADITSSSQEELNAAYEPPAYSLEYRFSFIMNLTIFALAFSAIWPPCIIILFITLLLSCIIDKYNLLRVYRKFDFADDLLSKNAIRLTTLGIFLRYLVLFIFYAMPDIMTARFLVTPYDIVITVCTAVSGGLLVAKVVWDFDMLRIFCVDLPCKQRRMLLTDENETVDNYPLPMYECPVKPHDVKFMFYDEQLVPPTPRPDIAAANV